MKPPVALLSFTLFSSTSPVWGQTCAVTPDSRAGSLGCWESNFLQVCLPRLPALALRRAAANTVFTKQCWPYLVVSSSVRDRTKLLGDSIAHGVGLAIFNVDGTDEQVIRDVVQMSTELEPGASSRNVVGGALSFDLG